MHRENEVSVDRPFFPAMVKDHRDHGHDLYDHLELAEFTGFDSEAARRRDGAQTAYQEFAANDDYRDPCGHQSGIELHQGDEGSGDQKLVGHRIEENADSRDLAALAGQVSIDTVGHGGGDEYRRREQFFSPVFAAEMIGR